MPSFGCPHGGPVDECTACARASGYEEGRREERKRQRKLPKDVAGDRQKIVQWLRHIATCHHGETSKLVTTIANSVANGHHVLWCALSDAEKEGGAWNR